MGLLLCWNDHIRPVDEVTFSPSSMNPYKNYHSCWGKNFVLKTLLHFAVVLLVSELNNGPGLHGQLFGAVN